MLTKHGNRFDRGLGEVQEFALVQLLGGERKGNASLAVAEFDFFDDDEYSAALSAGRLPAFKKQEHFRWRRALQSLEARGLVECAGTRTVKSGGDYGESAAVFAGKRVPIGYTRESTAYRLTDVGRIFAEDIAWRVAARYPKIDIVPLCAEIKAALG